MMGESTQLPGIETLRARIARGDRLLEAMELALAEGLELAVKLDAEGRSRELIASGTAFVGELAKVVADATPKKHPWLNGPLVGLMIRIAAGDPHAELLG